MKGKGGKPGINPLNGGFKACSWRHEVGVMTGETGATILPRKCELSSRHFAAGFLGHSTKLRR